MSDFDLNATNTPSEKKEQRSLRKSLARKDSLDGESSGSGQAMNAIQF